MQILNTMNDITIQATAKTPQIIGNVSTGTILIEGRCYPEDVAVFFHPFLNWLKRFQLSESESISVVIDIDYMNTSSGLILYRMLKEIKRMSNKEISFIWKHEADDIDMQEIGEDFQHMLGRQFKLEPKMRLAS